MGTAMDAVQQQTASRIAESLVVTAGAGSGKTRVLVERYINLITRQMGNELAGPEGIVAITFTEKAAAEMRERVARALSEMVGDSEQGYAERLKMILERLPQAKISTIDSFCVNLLRRYPMQSEVHPEFSILDEGDAANLRYECIKQAFISQMSGCKPNDRRLLIEKVKTASGRLDSFLKDMESIMNNHFTSFSEDISPQFSGDLQLTNMLNDAVKQYWAKAKKLKALDFALIEQKAVKLMRGPAGDEIREGIISVLVDEYQDTNKIQDQLIRLLVSKEDDFDTVLRTEKLFIVGDRKQSIYRFRGAEPSIFDRWVAKSGKHGKHVELAKNYRSHRHLVQAVNVVFERVMGSEYTKAMAGRDISDTLRPKIIDVISEPHTAPKGRLQDRTAEKVRMLLSSGIRVDEEGKQVDLSYRHIALLAPKNSSIGPYAEAFKKLGMPVAVIRSGAFYSSPSVAFMISLLETALNGNDDVSSYQYLTSPAVQVSEATIANMMARSASLHRLLTAQEGSEDQSDFMDEQEIERYRRAKRILSKARQMIVRLGSKDLLEGLSQEEGLERIVLKGYGRQGVANIRKLIEISASPSLSLSNPTDLLNHLISYKSREILADEPDTLDEGQNAIRMMSIHKAKGLEFPVVIIGDGNLDTSEVVKKTEGNLVQLEDGSIMGRFYDAGGESTSLYTDAQAELYEKAMKKAEKQSTEEKKRLLYVAITRAKEMIIISGTEFGKTSQKTGCFEYLRSVDADLESEDECSSISWDEEIPEVETGHEKKEEHRETPGIIEKSLLLKRENDRIFRFSPSSLMLFSECPKEFLRRHWFKLKEMEGTATSISVKKDTARQNLERDYSSSDLGIIVHFIAEHSGNAGEVSQAIEKAKEAFGSKLTEPPGLLKRVMELSQNYGRFLASSSGCTKQLREVPFELLIGKYVLEGIIDLLEEDEDGALQVTDFKTNNLDKASKGKLKEKYDLQLKAYAIAAARAYSTERVNVRLVFLDDGSIVETKEQSLRRMEEELLRIMDNASLLPERCAVAKDACLTCPNKSKCSVYEPVLEEYEIPQSIAMDLIEEVE